MAKSAGAWATPLTRAIGVKDGPELRTLADARTYVVALPKDDADRNAWQNAVARMLEAAEGGSADAATEAIEGALFLQARLRL